MSLFVLHVYLKCVFCVFKFKGKSLHKFGLFYCRIVLISLTSRCTWLKVMFSHRAVQLLLALVYTGKSRGILRWVFQIRYLLSVHGYFKLGICQVYMGKS